MKFTTAGLSPEEQRLYSLARRLYVASDTPPRLLLAAFRALAFEDFTDLAGLIADARGKREEEEDGHR